MVDKCWCCFKPTISTIYYQLPLAEQVVQLNFVKTKLSDVSDFSEHQITFKSILFIYIYIYIQKM